MRRVGRMSFVDAGALLWVVPLAGVVLLLYLLKMRRRNVKVPATFLWPEKVEEIRANALFQKLRPSWLLFLQLLALTLIVFALARPQTMQRGLAGQVTVLVLDTSASMSANDVKPSRFGEAKRMAEEAIRASKPGDRLALIEAGPTPRVVFPLSSDPAKQLQGLSPLEVTDAESNVGDALRLASALVGSIDGARIVLLSDGVFDKVSNFARGKAALVYKAIGAADDNLSINALGAADTLKGRQLYAAVKNHGHQPIDGTLTLYADGKVLDSIKIKAVAPDSTWGHIVNVPAAARIFEAKLDASDALKSDNYAVSISDPGASLNVLLLTKGNPFLERALALDPRVTLDRATELPSAGDTGKYDIVIFDGIPEQAVQARGVLTFGSAGPSSPVKASGTASKPVFKSQEEDPLLTDVDLRDTFFDSQHRVEPVNGAKSIASTSVGPMLVTSERAGKRQIYAAFDVLQSDFPLQIGFPIFVANALDFLAGGQGGNAIAVKPGQPFAVPWTKDATLKLEGGDSQTIKPNGAALVVREAKKVGKYTLSSGNDKKVVYSSMRSERESEIAPVKDLAIGGGSVKSIDAPMRFADFWRPLALLALLVLVGEWWLFAKRS